MTCIIINTVSTDQNIENNINSFVYKWDQRGFGNNHYDTYNNMVSLITVYQAVHIVYRDFPPMYNIIMSSSSVNTP